MTHETLLNGLWATTLTQLGGAPAITALARETKAFQRPRGITSAVDLLRIILAYCLGGMGLRSTTAWAASIGLADVSNVALLQRLRNATPWLQRLVEELLAAALTAPAHAPVVGRRIRLLDATTVSKAAVAVRTTGGVWRVHASFDLPLERFSFFELTDEKGAEHLERVPVLQGDILIADRGYMNTQRISQVLAGGADVIVRAGWLQVRWLDESGQKLDLLKLLAAVGPDGRIDKQIAIGRKSGPPVPLRLIAIRKPPEAAAVARVKARRQAKKEFATIGAGTLATADWVLLVTSLPQETFSIDAIADLYRARWRIEMAFKRLKSLIGLGGPPGQDPQVAKTWVLAHLLMILLLEPQTAVVEVSPRQTPARQAA